MHNAPRMSAEPAARQHEESGAPCARFHRVMEWFTGSIGYHHVPHLNAAIPFYRLRETMEAISELQHPVITRLRLRDILDCFQANLWDPQKGCMVSYQDAKVAGAIPS